MFYNFLVHEEESGLWGECHELDGCVSQGQTREELKKNLTEALNLYLEEPINSTMHIALPNHENTSIPGVVSIAVEPEIAFGLLLRYARQESHLTQKQAAARLGMKNLYSYQRLERRSNPTLSLLKRVKEVFPQISMDQLVETGCS